MIELLQLLPERPALALVPALGFALLGLGMAGRGRRLQWALALLWLLYLGWELYIGAWRSPSGDRAIRIDLLLWLPLLLLGTLLGLIAALRAAAQRWRR